MSTSAPFASYYRVRRLPRRSLRLSRSKPSQAKQSPELPFSALLNTPGYQPSPFYWFGQDPGSVLELETPIRHEAKCPFGSTRLDVPPITRSVLDPAPKDPQIALQVHFQVSWILPKPLLLKASLLERRGTVGFQGILPCSCSQRVFRRRTRYPLQSVSVDALTVSIPEAYSLPPTCFEPKPTLNHGLDCCPDQCFLSGG